MLEGRSIRLRLVREDDLPTLQAFDEDIANRGDFYPLGVVALPTLAARYAESGLWRPSEGLLLITDHGGELLGHIEFFETVGYLDELELSYLLYSAERRGRGVATEAVGLLTGYLFDRTKVNRIRLVIHPENTASRRVAEKAGYTLEGVARGAWYHRGHHHDVEVWAMLRAEHRPDGAGRDSAQPDPRLTLDPP
ncbi:MAG TPA: GNAT family protein [Ornithinibacter sp.]|nr:GNAT family protein [Ornithinibacter sp.]